MSLTKRQVAQLIDVVGTLAFGLIFIPAAVLMIIAMFPLAGTLRFLRWWTKS